MQMSKAPFYNRWDELTDEELERILDDAFRAVREKSNE
jgi:predicted phosphoribosyltransferase